jgi:hypothetical protein
MRGWLVISISLWLFACNKSNVTGDDIAPPPKYPGFTAFFIPQGANYCQQNEYHAFRGRQLSFAAIFDSSAIYTTANPANQADINKLYGVSDGNTHHQQNSARFGWNWNGKEIQVHAYCYAGGVRSYQLLGTAEIGKTYQYSIKADSSRYIFQFDDKVEYMNRVIKDSVLNGYSLYPYFGGDEPAPHAIRIYLKETNQ